MLNNVFWRTTIATVVAISITIVMLPTPSQSDSALATDAVVITDVRVFDGDHFIEQTNVLIDAGQIKRIGTNVEIANMRTINGRGNTLIPGLIDAHTHNFGAALQESLQFGVTTNIDMFTAPEFIRTARSNQADAAVSPQADLVSAGMLATAAGGHGTQFGISIEPLANPDQAEAWVDKRLAEGSDFIKLMYMPGNSFFQSLDRATATAVIRAAHNRQRLAVAHISTLQDAQDMLDAGIDGLVHIFADTAVTPSFLAQAHEQKLFVIPTLAVTATAAGKSLGQLLLADDAITRFLTPAQTQQLASGFGEHNWPEFHYEIALSNTKALHDAGIRILAGSDAPNPGTTYGASLHQELALLVEAGLSPTDALRSATSIPASIFSNDLRGRIAEGAVADLVLVKGDPSTDINATRSIESIYKNGQAIIRLAKPTATPGAAIADRRLSQFDKDLNGPSELVWSTTNDSMAGGTSTTSMERQAQTLKVVADVNPGFMFPWSGAALFGDTPLDISAYTQIEFAIKGTPGSYQVMSFSGEQAGAPPSQTVEVNADWQTIRLSLSGFRGLDSQRLNGIAIVAGPKLGRFEYSIRDVKLK